MGRILYLTAAFLITGMLVACDDEVTPDNCIDPARIDPDAACIEIYQPVCGCDNVTYGNSCFAEIAGVTSWREGTCGD